MTKLHKTNDPDYIKNEETGVFINSNYDAYNKYRMEKQKIKKMNNMESEISELKSLIHTLQKSLVDIRNKL